MNYKPYMTLKAVLDERFTDIDEVRDITNHGMAAGWGGFIYSSEIYDFFEKYEDEIDDYLYENDITLKSLVKKLGKEWTFQELREKAVWTTVELYCYYRLAELENLQIEQEQENEELCV